jgi:small subunit ribosomal protein S3Ae
VEITAQDVTGDFTKMHIKLYFKVNEVKNNEARTFFFKQDLTNDYVRRLARRKRTRIEGTFDVSTMDRAKLRVKPMAITEQRVTSSQRSSIRRIMGGELKKIASETLLQDFVKNVISGQISKRIAQACKPIHLVQRVEIRKTEFVSQAEVAIEESKPVVESEAILPKAAEGQEEEVPESEELSSEESLSQTEEKDVDESPNDAKPEEEVESPEQAKSSKESGETEIEGEEENQG